MACGLSNQEISAALLISLSTTKTHLASIQHKLRVRNRVEIAMWIVDHDPDRSRQG